LGVTVFSFPQALAMRRRPSEVRAFRCKIPTGFCTGAWGVPNKQRTSVRTGALLARLAKPLEKPSFGNGTAVAF